MNKINLSKNDKIFNFIDNKNTIYLTYSPAKDEYERICGHTFEVMDYYLLLKDNGYNAKILIFDKFKNKNKLFNAWEDKYVLDDYPNYKKDVIFKNINFNSINRLYIPGYLIITSGIDIFWDQIFKTLTKKIISFQCEEFDYSEYLKFKNFYLLRDERIYQNKNSSEKTFNYLKKIYFKRYKKINNIKTKKTLVYVNSKLKDLSEDQIRFFIKNYKIENILFISGTILTKEQEQKYLKYGELKYAPVENLFDQFDNYLVTPNTRNFDCSPRFVAECKFYNKEIFVPFNPKEDLGFYWRWYDIKIDRKILF